MTETISGQTLESDIWNDVLLRLSLQIYTTSKPSVTNYRKLSNSFGDCRSCAVDILRVHTKTRKYGRMIQTPPSNSAYYML